MLIPSGKSVFEKGQIHNHMGRKKRSFILSAVHLVLPVLAGITFGFTYILERNPHIAEYYFSTGVYPYVASLLSVFSSLFPFSVSDLFYVLLMVLLPVAFVLVFIRKIRILQAIFLMINLTALIYVLFYWLWGFNYFRQSAWGRLNLNPSAPDSGQFFRVFTELVDEAGRLHTMPRIIHWDKVDSLVESSFNRHAEFLKLDYPMGKRRPKPVTFRSFFSKAGISGYYGPFFGEVHINGDAHPLEIPVIMAHEKAHQFGITSEAEAGFFGWLLCYYSPEPFLQYSASLYALRYFINHGYRLDGFAEAISRIDPAVRGDLRAIRDHWMSLRDEKIDKAASKANDAYLKTNRIKEGIEDYKGIVGLIMGFKTDSALVRNFMLPSDTGISTQP